MIRISAAAGQGREREGKGITAGAVGGGDRMSRRFMRYIKKKKSQAEVKTSAPG